MYQAAVTFVEARWEQTSVPLAWDCSLDPFPPILGSILCHEGCSCVCLDTMVRVDRFEHFHWEPLRARKWFLWVTAAVNVWLRSDPERRWAFDEHAVLVPSLVLSLGLWTEDNRKGLENGPKFSSFSMTTPCPSSLASSLCRCGEPQSMFPQDPQGVSTHSASRALCRTPAFYRWQDWDSQICRTGGSLFNQSWGTDSTIPPWGPVARL